MDARTLGPAPRMEPRGFYTPMGGKVGFELVSEKVYDIDLGKFRVTRACPCIMCGCNRTYINTASTDDMYTIGNHLWCYECGTRYKTEGVK